MSVRDPVIQKAMDIQTRTGDVTSASREVLEAVHGHATRAADPESESEAESEAEARTATASDVYKHARGVGSDVSGMLLERLRRLSDAAVTLYESADTMEDIESASGVLRTITDSVGRLRTLYRNQLDEAERLASETVKGFAEASLFPRAIYDARVAEVGGIRDRLTAAVDELGRALTVGLARKGVDMESLGRSADAVASFDADFSARVGTVDDFRRRLAEPVDAAEAMIARYASVPGSFARIPADTEHVYSREDLAELNRRLDEML